MTTDYELCEISMAWTGLLGIKGNPTYRITVKNISTGSILTTSNPIEQDDGFLRGEAILASLIADLKRDGWVSEGSDKSIRDLLPNDKSLGDKTDGDIIRLQRSLASLPFDKPADSPKSTSPKDVASTINTPKQTEATKSTSDHAQHDHSNSAKSPKKSSSVSQKSSTSKQQLFRNVSCFVAGCNNPVISQCSGYQTSCGNFYCAEHSVEKLCDVCNGDLKREIKYLETLEIWEQEAKKLFRRRDFLSCLFLVPLSMFVSFAFFAVCMLGIGAIARLGEPSRFVVSLIVLIVSFGIYRLIYRWVERPKMRIQKIEQEYPGFQDYYEDYRRNVFSNRQSVFFGIAGAGMVVASGAMESVERQNQQKQDRELLDTLDHSDWKTQSEIAREMNERDLNKNQRSNLDDLVDRGEVKHGKTLFGEDIYRKK